MGVLLVGSLLHAAPMQAADVLAMVADDDLSNEALATLTAAIRRLAAAGKAPTAQLVLDEMRRVGALHHFAAKALQDAWMSGAQLNGLHEYAVAVVADSLHRRTELARMGLTESATDRTVADCARRLETLRGDGS